MGLLTNAAHHAAVRDMERQVWPQPPDWHPTRQHIQAQSGTHPPHAAYVLTAQPETECVRLEREQHTAIKSGLLKLEDAPMMACECDDCWRLYDATEVDGGEM